MILDAFKLDDKTAMLDEAVILIDIFTPLREDFLASAQNDGDGRKR